MFFKELIPVAIISLKNVVSSWIFGLNEKKKWTKICRWMIYAVSNNPITSKVYRIFLWNKKQWNADKENLFPKYALIFQIFQKYDNFLQIWVFFNFWSNVARMDSSLLVFERIRNSSYIFLCIKSYIWLNLWAKEGKKWRKTCQ